MALTCQLQRTLGVMWKIPPASVDAVFLPEFVKGSQELIHISHVEDPHNFFVQLVNHQSLIEELNLEFSKSDSLPQPSLRDINEGQILLVYSKAHKQWQRCRVMKIDNNVVSQPKFQVFFIDYGNIDSVDIDKLRLLSAERVRSPPPLAVNCSLANCEPASSSWTVWDSSLMQEIVDNKQALIHVCRVHSTDHGTVLECEVVTSEDSVNLAQALVFHGIARMRDPNFVTPIKHDLDDRPKLLWNSNDYVVNSVEDVKITHIISPEKFYIRKCSYEDHFKKLSVSLNNTYNLRLKAGSVYFPTKDMACVVNVDKYEKQVRGGGWRRAIVRAPRDNGFVEVVLVDTGEVATVYWTNLRHITEQFTTFKGLSAECRLIGVTPPKKRWSKGSLSFMARYQNCVLKVRVEEPGQTGGSLGVLLYRQDEQECLNMEMIRKKFAISTSTCTFDKSKVKDCQVYTTDIPMDKGRIEVNILLYKSPSLLYVSLTDQEKKFKNFFESIQTYYSKNKANVKTQWNVGDKCCTMCAENKTWRRAAILEIADELAKVFYIDFACEEKVQIDKLRELPLKFLTNDAAAIKCHLSNIIPAGGKTWASSAIEWFKDLIDSYQRLFITKHGIAKDMSIPIELWVHPEPDKKNWRCLSKMIVDIGYALPYKQEKNSNNSEKTKDADNMISRCENSIKDCFQKVETAVLSGSSTSKRNSSVFSEGPLKTISSQIEEQKPSTSKKHPDEYVISDWQRPNPLLSSKFWGIPTYIDNDGVIYLHDKRQQETLNELHNALERFDDSDCLAEHSDSKWSVEQPCIARFYVDGKFHRCRVKAIYDEKRTCLLHYVDYGNDEMCSVSNMRNHLVMCQLPVQAHKCILGRVKPTRDKWDEKTLDYISKMIVENNCQIKVIGDKIGDIIPIDITIDWLLVSEHLVELKMATFTDSVSDYYNNASSRPRRPPKDKKTKDIIESVSLGQVDKLTEEHEQSTTEIIPMYSKLRISTDNFVCTVSVIANDQFELLIKADDDVVAMREILHKEIQEKAPKLLDIDGIYEHKACVALFNGDNKWYRASILQYSEENQQIKVKYVDYGETALVDVSKVREALEKWTEMPAATVRAKLYGVSLNLQVDFDVDEFHATFMKRQFNATIIKRDIDCIYVELRDGPKRGPLAYQNLIDKKVFVCYDDEFFYVT